MCDNGMISGTGAVAVRPYLYDEFKVLEETCGLMYDYGCTRKHRLPHEAEPLAELELNTRGGLQEGFA